MFIDKFKKEVLIDDNHPLAVAQREKNARAKVAPSGGKGAGEPPEGPKNGKTAAPDGEGAKRSEK